MLHLALTQVYVVHLRDTSPSVSSYISMSRVMQDPVCVEDESRTLGISSEQALITIKQQYDWMKVPIKSINIMGVQCNLCDGFMVIRKYLKCF